VRFKTNFTVFGEYRFVKAEIEAELAAEVVAKSEAELAAEVVAKSEAELAAEVVAKSEAELAAEGPQNQQLVVLVIANMVDKN
jgi:hypothetical protein